MLNIKHLSCIALIALGSSQLNGMDQNGLTTIRQRITEQEKTLQQLRDMLCPSGSLECSQGAFYENKLKIHYQELTALVLNPHNGLSDQERLGHLSADALREARKKIIIKMIEVDKIDPNQIKWSYARTPLSDAVLFEDENFTKYLLEHKATIDKKTSWLMSREWNASNPAVILLLKSAQQ